MGCEPRAKSDWLRVLSDLHLEKQACHERAKTVGKMIVEAKAHIDHFDSGLIPVDVSDHAVVRFLERALGFDIQDIRRQLAEAAYLGGHFEGHEIVEFAGVDLVCRSGKVVTVVPRPSTPPRDGVD